MERPDVGKFWEGNAEAWTHLSRAGYDVCRISFNSPWFFRMLPVIAGKSGLDIGCGEGSNTRLLAERGAAMSAVDISETFIRHAQETENDSPLGIDYHIASAESLPFGNETFDFATGFMSFMDMNQPAIALKEAFRVIKPGGFLQFSISHPCFQTPKWRWIKNDAGRREAIVCGDYFSELQGTIEEWTFGAAPQEERDKYPKFRIPRFFFTLTSWFTMITDAGFCVERIQEPYPDDDQLAAYPSEYDARIIAYFMHFLCRKT